MRTCGPILRTPLTHEQWWNHLTLAKSKVSRMTQLWAHKHADIHRHTHHVYIVQTTHTQVAYTHTCIQHTICCMQFINFMGVIFEEFCIYICNCWHSVQVLILLVKYVFANLQVLVVLLFSHSQALSWCSEFLHSCYALNWAVPTSFLIHWHSDICRQMYCTTADLWNCNYIDSIPQDTNDRNTHELLCTCTHTVHCS